MHDPHVQVIHYAVGSNEGISYSDPELISFSNHLGTFDLADSKLHIEPIEHFSKEEDARRAVEPFLQAWEMEADLNSHVGMIRFTFERVELIDRDPPPPGSDQVIHVKASAMVIVGASVSLHITCRKYPQPPNMFRATPEVQHAYQRWIGFRAGKEPLQSMAYFVLTLLESAAGSRPNAARSFNIESDVLSTIGKLSSTKGDASTARKASPGTQFQELTGAEKQWLEKVLPLIIHRLGEHASGAPLTPISSSELPII